MYKLSTLSDSCSGRYPEGPLRPSDLRRTFACPLDSLRISEPSVGRSTSGHQRLPVPSASSEDLRPHYLTFGRWVNLRAPATTGTFVFIRGPSAATLDLRSAGQPPGTGVCQYLWLPSCDLGQPSVNEVMIPNSAHAVRGFHSRESTRSRQYSGGSSAEHVRTVHRRFP